MPINPHTFQQVHNLDLKNSHKFRMRIEVEICNRKNGNINNRKMHIQLPQYKPNHRDPPPNMSQYTAKLSLR